MDRIVIVDDEPGMLDVCRETLLVLPDVRIECHGDAASGLAAVRDRGADLVLTDIRMPGMSGLELLEAIRGFDPDLPVLLLTAFPGLDSAVQALRLGASDYLVKPFHPEQLVEAVRRMLRELRLKEENALLARRVTGAGRGGGLVGKSTAMEEVFRFIGKAAQVELPVLITGETGTGKELVAREIHDRSERRSGPFVPVDCGAIPGTLLESEFFGHEAGAFTGASGRSLGLVEYANGGVLFLDEIGELPLPLQAKLLRWLQDGTFRRLGGRETRTSDVRVMAATNRNLEEMVRSGAFREDLFYRLNVLHVHLPPLRERRGDIPLLASRILESAEGRPGGRVSGVDADALDVLTSYDWPGNVRELANVLRRAVALASGTLIGTEDLPDALVLDAGRSAPQGFFQKREEVLASFEREYLELRLAVHGGNVSAAAEDAGLPRSTFYRLLKRHGIQAERFR